MIRIVAWVMVPLTKVGQRKDGQVHTCRSVVHDRDLDCRNKFRSHLFI